jgi:4-hydroxy-2-oxoheptanedioate aldolase
MHAPSSPSAALRNRLKDLLANGETAHVMSVRFSRSVEIARIAGASGHDALYIDLQHSALGLDICSQICIAALAEDVTPLVRVPDHSPATMARVLDGGAMGVIVPDVHCGEQAQALAAQCLFPPHGTRSMATISPQARYSDRPFSELLPALNALTSVIVMLESEDAIANAEAIAAVAGVDALFIGTSDLSASMGLPGRFLDPRIKAAYQRVIDACKKHGKHALIGGIRDPAISAVYMQMGAARCFFTGSDHQFLINGARRAVAESSSPL